MITIRRLAPSLPLKTVPRTAHALVFALLVALGVGGFADTAGAAGGFSDVPDDATFASDISWARSTGATYGCNDSGTQFCPTDEVTRGEFAAFLRRSINSTGSSVPAAGTARTFTDVPGDHVFARDIEWMTATGITRGCNPPINDHFCPDEAVTRGQAAAFLARALGLTDTAPTFADTHGTTFAAQIGAIEAVGITKGCNPPANTLFCPDAPLTRAEAAALLHRSVTMEDSEDPGDDQPEPPSPDPAPQASDDSYRVTEGESLVVSSSSGLLSNDIDPNGELLEVIEVQNTSAQGALTVSPDGAFTYDANFDVPAETEVEDTFTYELTNSSGETASAQVAFRVGGITPEVNADTFTLDFWQTPRWYQERDPAVAYKLEDTVDGFNYMLPAAGLRANDIWPAPESEFLPEIVTQPATGTVTADPDTGDVTVTFPAIYSGTLEFTYRIADGPTWSEEVTVTLTVVDSYRPPTGRNAKVTGMENSHCIEATLIALSHSQWENTASHELTLDLFDFEILKPGNTGTFSFEGPEGDYTELVFGDTYQLSFNHRADEPFPSVCFTPGTDEHSTYNPVIGELEPFARLSFFVTDYWGTKSERSYQIEFVVEPVF